MKNPLRKTISEREIELPDIEIGKFLKIAVEDKSIISLGPGEPDYTPPNHILNAAKKSISKKMTHYSPVAGRKELREAIAKKLKKENKVSVNPDQVIVTCGSNEAVLLSMIACIDPGEQVLIPDPGFLSYIPTVELLNGQAISVKTTLQNNFQVTTEEIKKHLKNPKKVRAIIINTPNNPTGTVYSKKCLEEIADIAVEHDLMIVSDEAYEKLIYKGKHISMASLKGMEDYTLTLQSFSKSYGMAGFRVGYAAGPQKIIDAMKKLHILSTISASTTSQVAATAALKGSQSFMKKILKDYVKRKTFVCKRLTEMGHFKHNGPEGAFYIFPKYDFKMKSKDLAYWFIKNAKVAVMPGAEFGRYGEGFIRISYATDFNLIKKALNRLEKSVKKIK